MAPSGRAIWRPKLPAKTSPDLASKVTSGNALAVNASSVVTKEQFLEIYVQMELPKHSRPHISDGVQSQLLEAPPGLATPAKASESSVEASTCYQVLLRGLPDVFMYENVIRALLKAADLEDGIIKLSMRQGGKVLISFGAIDMVDECIRHFHDPQWATAGFSISALYVQTMKRSPKLNPANAPSELESSHQFSVDAPAFVPANKLSADAPEFVPLPSEMEEGCRESRASTFVPNSPEGASESDESEHDETWANVQQFPLWPPTEWTSAC